MYYNVHCYGAAHRENNVFFNVENVSSTLTKINLWHIKTK